MIPDMLHTFRHLPSDSILATFYIGCMGLIILFILERHKAIQLLEDSCLYMLLYKREIVVGVSLIILSFTTKLLILSYIIGAYHLYWVYKNYSTFAVGILKSK